MGSAGRLPNGIQTLGKRYFTKGPTAAMSGLTSVFSIGQMQMTDLQQAQTISTQIASTAQKQEMERWKILQDTETKCFEMQQEATINRAKTQDKLYSKWDDYIKS
ncbi:hypothetical protein IJT17_08105 [bacterium]|nr:hypothetical protein [bacterium]